MKVGTIPLMVQLPEMEPMRKRMTIAVVTSDTLPLMATSKSAQGTLKSHMASQTQIPAEKSRDTWLAPYMASLPKMLISTANKATSVRIGMREMISLDRGLFAISLNSFGTVRNIEIFLSFLCKIS